MHIVPTEGEDKQTGMRAHGKDFLKGQARTPYYVSDGRVYLFYVVYSLTIVAVVICNTLFL